MMDESVMIRTKLGKQNRSEMVAVLGKHFVLYHPVAVM
jgi:hypothetical protein